MMKYSIRVNLKRVKNIPKATVCVWMLLGLACLYCIIQLFLPTYRTLEKMKECEISIDKIHLIDSHDTKGSRMKLEIISENTTYYVWYPQSKYREFAYEIENELLSGDVTSVTAKVVSTKSIQDYLLNQIRIVDLRSNTSVYYCLNTEKDQLLKNKCSLGLVFLLLFVFWTLATLLFSLSYGVLNFQKRK